MTLINDDDFDLQSNCGLFHGHHQLGRVGQLIIRICGTDKL